MRTRKLPFWATFFTLLGVAVLCGLATWQLQRLEWKTELLAQMDEAFSATPAELNDLSNAQHLTRAKLEGRFIGNRSIAIQARTHNGQPGSHILTPFKTQAGQYILINRGWLALNTTIPTASQRPQTLTGLLKQPEQPNIFVPDNQPDTDAWYSIDVEQIAKYLEIEDLNPLVFYTEHSSTDRLKPAGTKPKLNNNHLQYACFWFAMAGVLIGVYILRFVVKKPD